jgi:hypothetical protein
MFFMVRTVTRGASRSGASGGGAAWLKLWALCLVLAVPIAGIGALIHAVDHHKPPAPIAQLVTFDGGWYSDYESPTFEVDATNSNTAAVTVHSVTVTFVNNETGQVIATATEQVGATVIDGGQTQTLGGAAPQATVNAGVEGRQIGVTVSGWS